MSARACIGDGACGSTACSCGDAPTRPPERLATNPCVDCDGCGHEHHPDRPPRTCPRCGGNGEEPPERLAPVLIDTQARVNELLATVEGLKAELASARSGMLEWRDRYDRVTSSDGRHPIEEIDALKVEFSAERADLHVELKQTQEMARTYQDRYFACEAERDALGASLADIAALVDEYFDAHQEKSIADGVQCVIDHLAATERERDNLLTAIAGFKAERDELHVELAKCQLDRDALNSAWHGAEDETAEVERERDDLRAKLAAAESLAALSERRCAEAETQRDEQNRLAVDGQELKSRTFEALGFDHYDHETNDPLDVAAGKVRAQRDALAEACRAALTKAAPTEGHWMMLSEKELSLLRAALALVEEQP